MVFSAMRTPVPRPADHRLYGDRDDDVVVDGCGNQCGCSGFDGTEDLCSRAYPFASWVLVGEVDGG